MIKICSSWNDKIEKLNNREDLEILVTRTLLLLIITIVNCIMKKLSIQIQVVSADTFWMTYSRDAHYARFQ